MPPHTHQSSPNILLRNLSPKDYLLLSADFVPVRLDLGEPLASAGEPIRHCFFMESGVASIVSATPADARTEVGIVGREGVAPLAILLGADSTPHDTFIQIGEARALRIEADRLRAAMDYSGTLRRALLRYVQAFLVQSAHSTLSNAHHRIESRLARWLLMCHDRVEGDELRLTHEFMSMMIAAQRTGVTVALHILEGAGMIRSRRAKVEILDRAGLVALAGDAYGAPEAEYRRLIGPFGKGQVVAEASGVLVRT